jgi:hypothetical protein
VGISIAQYENGRILKGESVGYALANRLHEELPVEIQTAWRGPTSITRSSQLALKSGEVRTLSVPAALPRGGTWSLDIEAHWPGGSSTSTSRLNVADPSLPKDFRLEDVEDLTLQMDVFNSLDGQWADKMVRINGLPAGRLPITGQTLKWHSAMSLRASSQTAHDILRRGLKPDGTLHLLVVIDNNVCNCFKVRNVQATLRTRSRETFVSTWSRRVHSSDAAWLYAEGECVPNGKPLPLEALSFLKRREGHTRWSCRVLFDTCGSAEDSDYWLVMIRHPTWWRGGGNSCLVCLSVVSLSALLCPWTAAAADHEMIHRVDARQVCVFGDLDRRIRMTIARLLDGPNPYYTDDFIMVWWSTEF